MHKLGTVLAATLFASSLLASGAAEARRHKTAPPPQAHATPAGQASHPGGGSNSK